MKYKNQILNFLGSTTLVGKDFQIETLYLDSHKCDNKSAFIALKGQSTDGNKYIEDVLAKGVKLVLSDNLSLKYLSNYHPELVSGSHKNDYCLYHVDSGSKSRMTTIICIKDLKNKLPSLAKWFYNYKKPQNIIGITGTNGKTSISNYIAQFLNLAGQKSLLLGTNGNGIYPNLKESSHTTLDILSLYQTISRYSQINKCHPELASGSHYETCLSPQIDSGSKSRMTVDNANLVMEVSSHSLDQKRIEGLDFDVAVFSNLSHDHLDYHKTMDSYFEAKAKLFKFKSLKKAVINIDDEYGQKLCDICDCEVVTVSLKSENADVYISVKNIYNMQTSFDLYIFQEYVGSFQTSLIAEFNLVNLGLSLAVLNDYIARDQLLASVATIKPVKGRMELIQLANNAKVVIDYAHTPDALEKVLQTLRKYSKAKLWCVFGCGGNRDKSKRSKMATIAEQLADKVIVTEDNNRFENIEDIFSDIKEGFLKPENHVFINSREKAINYCIKNSNFNDVILLAGKGHECYLDKNGIKEYFDEREVVKIYT
ncbi:UDP-N-acetylmuramoylalanyl-D-glutamate--2,6-diaminopimelate ligase [Allofrancisella inopinata]|uniref:UDP-N-acetylmuramyl-tripeptide synthetase n=1 Tax=Allofrancisella inopinata TaxID=1085647 RepID=A0AAE7CQJ5_9GAMM|nr:UDP-N-acetylmuramoyl-L-alanyl-D-glutamate--2,6-diaminopimelate ligase [Allofrancisella inopinata]QIV95911.1 UDP-N-acetylmuramoyl-L-alanyl-D-glutamate--2,6-diaminopimelate ligase [Allofrancisella inopinata]TDT74328.1 UDP-N-acetylmuramoylalanyl-D-glutamate--2,6-diaminopimelate ligase [Allofrancisella inopinata]